MPVSLDCLWQQVNTENHKMTFKKTNSPASENTEDFPWAIANKIL